MDGKPLALPADIEGVLLLNIPSYAGGVNLWASGAAAGSAEAQDAVQSVCDGMLEVSHSVCLCPGVLKPFRSMG